MSQRGTEDNGMPDGGRRRQGGCLPPSWPAANSPPESISAKMMGRKVAAGHAVRPRGSQPNMSLVMPEYQPRLSS